MKFYWDKDGNLVYVKEEIKVKSEDKKDET